MGILKKLFKKNEFLTGSLTLMILRVIGMGISYLFTWLIAKFYGTSVLGLFAITNVVILVGVTLTRSGMDIYFLRSVSSLTHSESTPSISKIYGRILSIQVLIGSCISLALFVGAEFLSNTVFHEPSLTHIFQLAPLAIMPTAWSMLHAEGFRGKKQFFNYITLTRVWPFLFGSTAILILHLLDLGGDIYFFLGYFIGVIINATIGFGLWNKNKSNRLTTNIKSVSPLSILEQSLPMMLASSMFLVMSWTDTFMLGIYTDSAKVGSYHVAVKISNMVTIFLYGINGISAPAIARYWSAKETASFKQIVVSSATLGFVLTLPIILIIIIFRRELLELFGDGISIASMGLVLLTLGQFVNASCGSVMNILQMTHHQRIGQNILLVAGGLNILLNSVLIPIYGIEGAALSTAISTVFWNLTSVIAVRRKLHVWSFPFAGKFAIHLPFKRS